MLTAELQLGEKTQTIKCIAVIAKLKIVLLNSVILKLNGAYLLVKHIFFLERVNTDGTVCFFLICENHIDVK